MGYFLYLCPQNKVIMESKEKLREKEQRLINASKVLKDEFVGIDDVIDGVISNIKSWYMIPEMHNSPLIVNLFGLTGTGKTSLVKRLCELLDIDSDMFYFNFAEIGECNSWEIEDRINDELSDEKSNRVFVYDEFQFASTLTMSGEEKDKKSGMKPFWELIDTGKFHRRNNWWDMKYLDSAVYYMRRICSRENMLLENGVWVNANECLSHFTDFEVNKMRTLFRWDERSSKEEKDRDENPKGEKMMLLEAVSKKSGSGGTFFLSGDVWGAINKVMARGNMERSNIIYEEVIKMDVIELINFLSEVYYRSLKGYDMDFHNSLIFVIANVDEAYEMALSVDPDMSPDMFHKISKKITIVDIKSALQKRFRNEQIARLGNIQHIYPSFSSASFKEIIRRELSKFCADNEKLTGWKTEFDKSLVTLIFKESVFPTHGTRPILSTIYDIVKSKTASAVLHAYEKDLPVDKVVFGSSGLKTTVSFYDKDGGLLGKMKMDNKIRIENLRQVTNKDTQPIVALHESGHFILYNILTGKLPEKLVSVTVGKNSNGFMMESHDSDEMKKMTIKSILDGICISLGGYAAEKMVFGSEHMTCGASADISYATACASKLVRNFGYYGPYKTTFLHDIGHEDCILDYGDSKDEINIKIKGIIDSCLRKVEALLREAESQLGLSAQYLTEHPSMPKSKMEEISETLKPISDRFGVDDDYYKRLVMELGGK